MKKLTITILLMLVTLFSFTQNYRGYNIEAVNYLIAADAFVVGTDTVNSTTQLSGLDSVLVTLEYLKNTISDSITANNQTLSFAANTLSISEGNSVDLSELDNGGLTLQNVTDNGVTTTNAVTVGGLTSSGNITNGRNNYMKTNGTITWGNGSKLGRLSWDVGKLIIQANANNSLSFGTNSGSNQMVLTKDYNLLIGTTVDTGEKLQVNGNIYANNSKIDTLPTNKRWVIFGDSFSNSLTGDYPSIVINRLGFKGTVTNGVSGNKIAAQLDTLDARLAVDANYLDGFDIISLLIGVNDFAGNTTLGCRSSLVTENSFAGRLKDFIETVLNANPFIELYLITPTEANGAGVTYNATNSVGWTIRELSVLISQIASDYAIQCIDLYSLAQFNKQTINSLTVDGLHPNDAGKAYIGNIIADGFINRINLGKQIDSDVVLDSIDSLRVSIVTNTNSFDEVVRYNHPSSYNNMGTINGTHNIINGTTTSTTLLDYNVISGYHNVRNTSNTVKDNLIIGALNGFHATGNVQYSLLSGYKNAYSITGDIAESVVIGNANVHSTTNAITLKRVIAMPYYALNGSTADILDDAIALGYKAGYGNAYNSPALFGRESKATANNQVVIGSIFYTGGIRLDGDVTGTGKFTAGKDAVDDADLPRKKQLENHTLDVDYNSVTTGNLTATGIKLTTGAINGYYLRTDASGNGSWQAVSASSVYKGILNAATGTPSAGGSALIDGVGTSGDYYATADTGTYDYGDPSGNSISLALGDELFYNGSAWEKRPGASGVTSVNALTGAVLLYPELSGNDLNIRGNTTTIDIGDATDVAANSTKRHDALTIGSANGLSLSSQQLSLEIAGASTTGALSSSDWTDFNNKLDSEVDGSVTNELQELSISGKVISLSNTGGSVTIPDVTLSDLQTATGSDFHNIGGTDAVDDADHDITNEIQTLGLSVNTLGLTSGGAVDLVKYLDNTDNQQLSISGHTITLEDGGNVTVPDNDTHIDSSGIADYGFVTSNEVAGTDLTKTRSSSYIKVNSSTGADVTIYGATSNYAGIMTNTDKIKLDGIAASAEVNVNADWNSTTGDSQIFNKPTTITTAQASDIETNNTKVTYPSADAAKLSGIESGAEANVNADWNASSGDAEILNKPDLSGFATITTAQDITGEKAFAGANTTLFKNGTNGNDFPVEMQLAGTNTFKFGNANGYADLGVFTGTIGGSVSEMFKWRSNGATWINKLQLGHVPDETPIKYLGLNSSGDVVSTSGGNVTKVGTPSDNQVAVWTGDGTIEGTNEVKYNGRELQLTDTYSGIDVRYIYDRDHSTQFAFSSDYAIMFNPLVLYNYNTVESGTTTDGEMYYNSTLKKFRVKENGSWVDMRSSSGGGVSFGTDNQIPIMNSAGTDFEYTSEFKYDGTFLYADNLRTTNAIYTNKLYTAGGTQLFDLNSNHVKMNKPLWAYSSSSVPSTSYDGFIYYNTSDNALYGKIDGNWADLGANWEAANQGTIDPTNYTDNVNDADHDITNEIQALSISDSQLTLSKGGNTVTLPTYWETYANGIRPTSTAYEMYIGNITDKGGWDVQVEGGIYLGGIITMGEMGSVSTPSANTGTFWIDNEDNLPRYTSDGGISYKLTLGERVNPTVGGSSPITVNYINGNVINIDQLSDNITVNIINVPTGETGIIRFTQNASSAKSVILNFYYNSDTSGTALTKKFFNHSFIDSSLGKITRVKFQRFGSKIDVIFNYEN